MSFTIDLKEISQRESEKVEWKKNGDDKNIAKNIVKTICAFANDINNFGGGYVVCGAKETKDAYGFQKLEFTGLSANKLKEIEGKVLEYCNKHIKPSIAPIVEELTNPENAETKILVFIIMSDSQAHTYKDGETSRYYVRIGRETREAENGILRQLLEKKGQIEPFDKRANPNVDERDIDSLLFRDSMNEMNLLQSNKQLEDYYSDKEQIAEFVPPLLVKKTLDNSFCLRNFSLFLFGKKDSFGLLFPDAYTNISIYNGIDRSESTAERYTINGSIINQAKKAIDLLNTYAYTVFDKTSEKPNREKFPKRALQEAVINAIVHRDYEIADPVRISIFSDRIEIRSPGTLHWGVDREKFKAGKASPRWRNQSFSYLFNKLQLAQSEGQGIPTIIRTMKEEGHPDPVFEIEDESVTCILPAHQVYEIKSPERRLYEYEYASFVEDILQKIIDHDEITKSKKITIEREKRITDKNGKQYIFDLYWEYELGGIIYKTIVECKDIMNKVSIDNIYSLIKILDNFPELHGVFATRTGYQHGAIKKAHENNMDLLVIREQNASDWVDENGNPLIKQIHFDIISHSPAIIHHFQPLFDVKWVKENTDIDITKPYQISGLNNEIYIDDMENNEKYSLLDLSSKLSGLENNKPGDYEKTFEFLNAFILVKDKKIKISGYNVKYSIQTPITNNTFIDFSEELSGVVEYISKNTKKLVFKDGLVK